jgi:hypothetical protein
METQDAMAGLERQVVAALKSIGLEVIKDGSMTAATMYFEPFGMTPKIRRSGARVSAFMPLVARRASATPPQTRNQVRL